MVLIPRREYITLLMGDIVVFVASLYVTLGLRFLELPSRELFLDHFFAFLPLFFLWVIVFFLAGLYGKHTRLFRSRLSATILYTQIVNVTLAALFFFLLPFSGLTPKTILAIYLAVSSLFVFLWRRSVFTHTRRSRKLKGMLLASGPDAEALAHEIQTDPRAPFVFSHVIDTKHAPTHEIVQRACQLAGDSDVQFVVADFYDKAVSAALPIIYDATFKKQRFSLINLADLYQEVFDRAPLSLVQYEWILSNVSSSPVYDTAKRTIDVCGALVIGALTLPFYPLVMLLIKIDDGGPVFFRQERTGRFQRPMYVYKFRTMSGVDSGDEVLKSKHVVTRVGKWLRILRIDELPQIANVIIGDLSLVGPRPEIPTLSQHYSARIPYYNARFLIPPGLTGWAQITHDRHPHHGADVVETKEKLSYDLYYLQHRSLLLDIFILLQTLRIVITARGA